MTKRHSTKHWVSMAVASLLTVSVHAKDTVELSAKSYDPEQGVVIIFINWGRTWNCGGYENAQLQALAFTRAPFEERKSPRLELKTPSKLMSNPTFERYAFVVAPGEYALTGFDVKIARSVNDVGHMIGNEGNLLKEGKPAGGLFNVNAGEAIYIGHFGLDCAAEPFLWRFYAEEHSDFERLVAGLRDSYPVLKDVPVTFRLFSTGMFGTPFAFENPTIQ